MQCALHDMTRSGPIGQKRLDLPHESQKWQGLAHWSLTGVLEVGGINEFMRKERPGSESLVGSDFPTRRGLSNPRHLIFRVCVFIQQYLLQQVRSLDVVRNCDPHPTRCQNQIWTTPSSSSGSTLEPRQSAIPARQ